MLQREQVAELMGIIACAEQIADLVPLAGLLQPDPCLSA